MSDAIFRAAMFFAVMIVMGNVGLMLGGFVTPDQVPAISRVLIGVNLTDSQTEDYQDSLFLKENQDPDGNIVSIVGQSTISQTLDFFESIPLIGPLFTLVRVVYELLLFGAFGAVFVAGKMGLPNQIIIFLGAFFFIVYVIAMYQHLRDYILARGTKQ